MRVCILSDPYCDAHELASRKVMEELFAGAIASVDGSVEISKVWMSDVSLRCNDKGIQISLPDGAALDNYDVIYPRVFLEQPLLTSAVLEAAGSTSAYVPFGVHGYDSTLHKFLSLLRTAKLGFPVPESSLSGTKKITLKNVMAMRLPVVFKRISGYGGAGVMKASQADEVPALLDAFHSMDELLIAQKLVHSKSAHGTVEDLRVLVIGDKTFGIRRTTPMTRDFRSGISTGGHAKEFSPSQKLHDMSVQIAREMQLDICGIDFIEYEEDAYVFLEVNCTPGMYVRSDKDHVGEPMQGITTRFVEEVAKLLVSKGKSRNTTPQ
jgi:RimK family alpha-L-glutamate ligase